MSFSRCTCAAKKAKLDTAPAQQIRNEGEYDDDASPCARQIHTVSCHFIPFIPKAKERVWLPEQPSHTPSPCSLTCSPSFIHHGASVLHRSDQLQFSQRTWEAGNAQTDMKDCPS